jgi:DNA polymerase-3 subunit delta'
MWRDFIGNLPAVERLRDLAARGGGGRTLILAGPEGVGKTTLAVMFGLALNCLAPPQPGEFCGACASCRQALPLDGVEAAIAAALEHRAAEVKGNARETAPLRVAVHPAVLLYPPDGDFLTMAQARAAIRQTQLQPDPGQTWTLILPHLDAARWTTQSALLKTLEEPTPRTALVALARNPLGLLPTVRSRALVLALQPVPPGLLAAELARRRPALALPDAALLARLAAGCPGRALRLDLDAYRQLRDDALRLLAAGRAGAASASVIRLSESTRAGKEKFESLAEILYSVLQDIVYLHSGLTDSVRNGDVLPELQQQARLWTASGLAAAVAGLDELQAAARRNAFRPLGLASWALNLGALV